MTKIKSECYCGNSVTPLCETDQSWKPRVSFISPNQLYGTCRRPDGVILVSHTNKRHMLLLIDKWDWLSSAGWSQHRCLHNCDYKWVMECRNLVKPLPFFPLFSLPSSFHHQTHARTHVQNLFQKKTKQNKTPKPAETNTGAFTDSCALFWLG